MTFLVGDRQSGQWLLPTDEKLGIGRGVPAALRAYDDWLPRQLVRFTAIEEGWLAENGPRTRVRLQHNFVGDAHFGTGALVALQVGKTQLSWPELDDVCRIGIQIESGSPPPLDVLVQPPVGGPTLGTALAMDRVDLESPTRAMLAVLFRHMILHEARPANLAASAVERLGRGEQAIKNAANRVRERINRQRWEDLKDLEQLGYYLVNTTGTITVEDLPEEWGLPG